MSYSFRVRAATKAEAVEKVTAELAKVVASQPVHAVDYKQAQAAAEAYIALMPESDMKDLLVSVSGSTYTAFDVVQHANVGVSVTHVNKTDSGG